MTQYIVVRADLPVGIAAAQIAHAAGAGSARHPEGTYVVVLAARDESHLRGLEVALRDAGVDCTLVVESDAPYDGQATAIGCALVRDRAPTRRVLSSLPLYGRDAVRVTRQTSPPLELPTWVRAPP